MSDGVRIWVPYSFHHVTARGVWRNNIYRDEDDYLMFLKILKAVKVEYDIKVCSLCLMTNHFHLLIGTNEIHLGSIMQKLMFRYARTFNRKYFYAGHLFERRYTNRMIMDRKQFLTTSRYIHQNPVKAHIVENPYEYIYSDYAICAGYEEKEMQEHIKSDQDMIIKESIQLIHEIADPDVLWNYFWEEPEKSYRKYVSG